MVAHAADAGEAPTGHVRLEATAADAGPPPAIRIEFGLTRLLYEYLPLGLAGTIVIAGILAYAMSAHVGAGWIALWMGGILIVSAGRYWLCRQFAAAAPGPADGALWQRRFELGALLSGASWGAASILCGTAIGAWLRAGARRSDLLKHFAIQTSAWGAAEVLIALALWMRVAPRDIASATRLDRLLWLSIGLDIGYLIVGITLITAGWRLGKRLGLVGAGIGVVVQGFALALLGLMLAIQISR